MPQVEVSRSVPASAEAVYAFLRRMEEFPRYMKSVDEVRVLERGEGFTVTRWATRLHGAPFRWTERDEFDDRECRVRYRLVEGDLKRFEGEWILEPSGGCTKVTLTVDFEFGMPMIASLLNPVARLMIRENVLEMLAAVERALSEGGDAP